MVRGLAMTTRAVAKGWLHTGLGLGLGLSLALISACEGDFEYCEDDTACPTGQVCNLIYNACEAPQAGADADPSADGALEPDEGVTGGGGGGGMADEGVGDPDEGPGAPDQGAPPVVACTTPGWTPASEPLRESGWALTRSEPTSGEVRYEGGRLRAAMSRGRSTWARRLDTAPLADSRGRFFEARIRVRALTTDFGTDPEATSLGGLALSWRLPGLPPIVAAFEHDDLGFPLDDGPTLPDGARWPWPQGGGWHLLRLQLTAEDEAELYVDGERIGRADFSEFQGERVDDLATNTAEISLTAGCPSCRVDVSVDFMRWGCVGLEAETPCVIEGEDDPLCWDKGEGVCAQDTRPAQATNAWVDTDITLTAANDTPTAMAQGPHTQLALYTRLDDAIRLLDGRLIDDQGATLTLEALNSYQSHLPLAALWHPGQGRYLLAWADLESGGLRLSALSEAGEVLVEPQAYNLPTPAVPTHLALLPSGEGAGVKLIALAAVGANVQGAAVFDLDATLTLTSLDIVRTEEGPVTVDPMPGTAPTFLAYQREVAMAWSKGEAGVAVGLTALMFDEDGQITAKTDQLTTPLDPPALIAESNSVLVAWPQDQSIRGFWMSPDRMATLPKIIISGDGPMRRPQITRLGVDTYTFMWWAGDALYTHRLKYISPDWSSANLWDAPLQLSTGEIPLPLSVPIWTWDDEGLGHTLTWLQSTVGGTQRLSSWAGPFGGCP